MSMDEMNREELLEYKKILFWKKNEIMNQLETKYQLQAKSREEEEKLNKEQMNYRIKILNAIDEMEHYIYMYYCKLSVVLFGSKKFKQEKFQLLKKASAMYYFYAYLFKNDMDEYLFDPKTYTFQDQVETIEKRNYDLELYEELESKIPGVMDDYFDAKVTYCKDLPGIRKRKAELVSNPITEEDEIHMKQKLNLIEMEIASVERVLKAKEMELKL